MSKFIKFLYEFMSVFFDGIKSIFMGIVNGFVQIFNVPEYIDIIAFYKEEFGMLVYEKDGMKLQFILEGDEITSIEYTSTVLDAQ